MSLQGEVREKTRTKVEAPKLYHVIMHNDDFTPMDFVVEVLMQIFDKEEAAATSLMLSVHQGSYAVAGVYPRDIACTKAAEAVRWAREEGYPLKVEAMCQ